MLLVIPALGLLYVELKGYALFEFIDSGNVAFRMPLIKSFFFSFFCSEQSMRILRLGVRSAILFGLALTCWILDKFFCDTWWGSSFPYLHAMWHILIFISSYTICVLFAYYAVKEDHINRIPDLRFWPKNNFELGIPFVSIKCYYTDAKCQI